MNDFMRYRRQMLLPEIGWEGQERLARGRVLVVGLGGLGCPVAQYLVAAGVGMLRLVDGDVVQEENLHRQILFGDGDIGKSKVEVAREQLCRLNPHVTVEVVDAYFDETNFEALAGDVDVVVDCTDRFDARLLIDHACRLYDLPHVYGALYRWQGQCSVFGLRGGARYVDVFGTQVCSAEVPTCAETGILGPLAGIVAAVQAGEVLRLLATGNSPLAGVLWFYDLWRHRASQIRYDKKRPKDDNIPQVVKSIQIDGERVRQLTGRRLEELLRDERVLLLDVRQPDEVPRVEGSGVLTIPLGELPHKHHFIPKDKKIVPFCQKGIRAQWAAQWLAEAGYEVLGYYALESENVWSDEASMD